MITEENEDDSDSVSITSRSDDDKSLLVDEDDLRNSSFRYTGAKPLSSTSYQDPVIRGKSSTKKADSR